MTPTDILERLHVQVKPLEWGETSYGTPEVVTVVGVYRINTAWSGGWSVTAKNEFLRDTDGRENFATLDAAKAAAQADFATRICSTLISSPKEEPLSMDTNTNMDRDKIDAWLSANCGNGLPYGEATDDAAMLHGLAYILRQIEGTDSYCPHIGQSVSATSALRAALDHFAIEAINKLERGTA